MRLGAPALLFSFLVPFVNGRSLSVKLLDATYVGYHNSTSGLDIWLGVRYAAPPVGDLRWRAAQPTVKGNATVNATIMPLQCIQSQAAWNATNMSEDCLYLNVYSPPNAKNLPVLVWIHGGSWDHNGAYQFDPTPLINLSGNKFVASGGGTVLELLVQEGRLQKASGSKYQSLFKAGIMSSPWFPPLGKCSDTYFKDQFLNFTIGAGCASNSTDASLLSCLRAAPSSTLRQLNYQMNKAQRGHVNYWTACIEESSSKNGYLKIHPIQAFRSGLVGADYVLAGSNAADGSAPTNLSMPALFENFLTTYWPLTAEQVAKVVSLYPESGFTDSHARGVSVYQDAVFACGSTWAAEAFTKRKGSWRYLFGILPAVHAQDNAYEFPYWYNYRSPAAPSVFAAFGGAITNFTVRGNPNSKALNGTWPQSRSGNQIAFNMTSPANVSETHSTGFYDALSGTKERCDFWANARLSGGW
ncbi:hypothetical protein FRC11_007645 [Ceratobasidium sp. 423]|nr:hypothetical protein FRC11_007645 [Ceratobasidium sp. 423]